jgi:hypothetical protein
MDGKSQKRNDGGVQMKRQMILALVAVLAVGAAAQAATSQVDVTFGPVDGLGFFDGESRSYGYAANGLGAQDSQLVPGTFDSSADAVVPGAEGYGWTQASGLAAGAFASTAGVGSAGAYGEAYQYLYFSAPADGEIAFSAPYDVLWSLDSGGPAGTAFFDAQVNMQLAVYGVDGWILLDQDLNSFESYAENGGIENDETSAIAHVSADFYEGEYGYLFLWVDAQATATVPVPGAIVLGLVGTGLVGAWRRRKAL